MNEAREGSHPPVTEISTAQSFQISSEDVQHGKKEEPRAGDKIDVIARYYVDQWNASALATALRERRLSITEFRHYITKMYPMVVGFNGGLIQSITKSEELQQSALAAQLVKEMQKVDHVRNSQRVGKLAVELQNIAREDRLPLLRALAGVAVPLEQYFVVRQPISRLA